VVLGTSGIAVRLNGFLRSANHPEFASRVRLTALLVPNLGRDEDNLPSEYDGIGNIPMTAEAGLDGSVRLWRGLKVTGMVAVDALNRGHRGSYSALGAQWTGSLPGVGLQYTIGVETVGATKDYMEAYYGISEEQAADTLFDSYEAALGVESVRGGLTLVAPLANRVTVVSETSLTSFVGYARNSPIVQSTEQVVTQLLVMYQF
jgi:outer membrane scaffolding protein for murein synthesis (MipA/OmpV family)